VANVGPRSVGREHREHHLDLALPQQAEAVAELVLPDLHLAVGVSGLEHLGHLEHELAGGGAHEAHPQHAADPAGRADGPVDPVLDLLEGGTQVVLEPAADRGQLHPPAGPLEQRRPDAALQLLDRLAHPGRRHVQPLGSAAEVKLLRQGQEDL
jgi:hypothetical protein